MGKPIRDEDVRFNLIINGNEAQKELHNLETQTRKLTQRNKELAAEKTRLEAAGKKETAAYKAKETAAYKAITAEMRQNNAAIKGNKASMQQLQKQIGITGLTMGQLRQRASQLRLQLNNMVPGSAQYIKLQADLKAVNTRISELSLKARAAQGGLSSLAQGFNKYALMAGSFIAAGTGLVLSMQKMIDFNGKLSDAQADVMKTTGMTKDEVDSLTKSFGMFKTRTARMELLELSAEAGRLGITGVKNVKDFVEVANQMKVALGDILSDEEIREVGKMVNIYKVGEATGKDFKNSMLALGSALNEVGATGANTETFLVDYLKRQAGVAAQAKLSAADNIGYAATFDEIGQSVEISATAMNKIWMDMFKNTDTFAKIAGMSVKDFTELLNTDANEAMIRMLEGLNGNNEGLSIMVEKLADIEVGGARGAQALSAIAGQTDLLRKRQVTANQALTEATSLTKEYELKNNNLAATLEKVKKQLLGAFASPAVIGGLSSIVNWFARLIGAVEDVDKAFAKETKQKYESAKANQKLVVESQKLLNEYEDLTKDGIEPTEEAKQRLDEITLQLKDRLGESVIEIDKETGAFKLNTQAVRDQIAIKRIASDEEAATLMSRKLGAEQQIKDTEQTLPQLKRELEARKRLSAQASEALRNSEKFQNASEKGRLGMMARIPEVIAERDALLAYSAAQGEIVKQQKRINEIANKLNDLNFSEQDFKTIMGVGEGPKEGDTQTIDGMSFIFKNGKWEPVTIAGGGGGGGGGGDSKTKKEREENLKKEQEALLKLQREGENARLALIQNTFAREMAINDANHVRKVTDLQTKANELIKAFDEATIAGDTDLASTLLDQYTAINNQIEAEEGLHQQRRNEIIKNGIEADIAIRQEQFKREEQERLIAHNNELAELGNNEEAKKALEDQFNKDTLERQKAAAISLKQEIEKTLDTSKFEGFSLDLITEEQKQQIIDRLQELGLSIAEINKLLAQMQGKAPSDNGLEALGLGGETDILGFTPEQWDTMFTNFSNMENLLANAVMGVMAMQQAYAMFSDFQNKKDADRLKALEKNFNRKEERQKQLLDRGLITQKQYDDSIKAMDAELEKKKEEIAKKQAKREKVMALASIATNTAMAIMSIWAQVPKFDFGISAGILTAFVGALGLAQAAMVLTTKGYEKGFYNNSTIPVRREQDGKAFNASFGGQSRSGVVDKPTVFLAGEGGKNFPEMIIDGRTLKQFDPGLKDSLYRELSRVRGFENGHYSDSSTQGGSQINEEMMTMVASAINRNTAVLEKLDRDGVTALMDKDMRNIYRLRKEFKRLETFENKSKRNN